VSNLIDYRDRTYVSQYAGPVLGVQIHIGGALADPDGSAVSATLVAEGSGTQVFSRAATRAGTGVYQVALASAETAVPGDFTLVFTFTVAGTVANEAEYLQVGLANPDYDQLPDASKDIVESVVHRLADLYDSPGGGPNLATYVQSRYSRGRLGQLLRIAIATINTVKQPVMNYSADGLGGPLFPEAYASLAERGTYIETIKHLRRSYTEQPDLASGADVTRLDRRDYLERWGEILADEVATYNLQLDTFKIMNMGLGRPRVLVSGGVFGRYAPTRIAGSAAARPRFFSRFY
jgi:hypothetical protein